MFDTYVITVEYGTNSTYEHSHMPKINSSYVKICESSCPRLAQVSPASRPKILNCYPRRSKLNKSKLTGDVNVNKMVLPWVSCWWWSCCFCLAENANNQLSQSVVTAGGGWRRERHRLNSSTSLSQPCLPTNHRAFFANVRR